MIIIKSPSSDASFNIASEEYLFNQKNDNIFLLYQNERAIIVGRKQNTLAEINHEYTKANNIQVVRRMSGGGAVFHDINNLNFCFIIRDMKVCENSFEYYTKPIISTLKDIGIEAKLEGRNDLTIDSKKFSGNAKYFKESTLLQHGTLLFDSNINDISQALNNDPSKFNDKAVKSIKSRVTNIKSHLNFPLTISEFENMIVNKVKELYSDAVYYEYNDHDYQEIEKLKVDKYSNWNWNFGKSPEYNYRKKIRCLGGTIEVVMSIKNGFIEEFKLYGDFFSKVDLDEFENSFVGINHSYESTKAHLEKYNMEDLFVNVFEEDFLNAMFF
ncbi:MAG TPA: lipoate--protein ligase [Candidatus Cloacimonadota bacterium]|jgi:lipoate-protein ligase A|nr:lipoate--protein ligase [Candidatus Cloacimonadales bacterium]HOQ80713.1 lipoate--protein ligase [Candidatus Cloacimonadota bacterium]HPY95868.1 lipoate--protein ligase [Candidatus Cloacimonadota bacterium]HQB41037.1 lipoate--protein ligase [Candidatus Cloacimonadota bacterium]